MSRHRITVVVDVDDEELAEHIKVSDRRGGPYTTDVSEWDGSDLFAAARHGIIDEGEVELAWYDGLVEAETS